MSLGTFADMASKNHQLQTTKQKRIVFGERPSTISAQSLISTQRMQQGTDVSNANATSMLISTPNMSTNTIENQAQGRNRNNNVPA